MESRFSRNRSTSVELIINSKYLYQLRHCVYVELSFDLTSGYSGMTVLFTKVSYRPRKVIQKYIIQLTTTNADVSFLFIHSGSERKLARNSLTYNLPKTSDSKVKRSSLFTRTVHRY